MTLETLDLNSDFCLDYFYSAIMAFIIFFTNLNS